MHLTRYTSAFALLADDPLCKIPAPIIPHSSVKGILSHVHSSRKYQLNKIQKSISGIVYSIPYTVTVSHTQSALQYLYVATEGLIKQLNDIY